MKFVLISFFLVGWLTIKVSSLNGLPIFEEIFLETNVGNYRLAEKYCDSIDKNLFKGLDKESTLKYEYFFSSIPDDLIKDENKFLEIFKIDVESICSFELSKANEKEFISFFRNYFKTKSNTPKTNVEEINPTPINTAMIPVLR